MKLRSALLPSLLAHLLFVAGLSSVQAMETAPAASGSPTVAPKLPVTEQGVKSSAKMVGNLIENSSSAKQIDHSGTPEARALREEARKQMTEANAALEKGDFAKADQLIKSASRTLQQAVKQAHPEELAAAKAKHDFGNRRETVRILISTNQRVAKEKGSSSAESDKAEDLLKIADAYAAANKHAEGLEKLNEAYTLVKDSVRNMRGGEELKAEKNFATKADEFEYEVMRNDDYQNLIPRLGKISDSSEESAKKGKDLREEANKLAKGGDYEAALKKINESTGQLKSVLRAAGLPII